MFRPHPPSMPLYKTPLTPHYILQSVDQQRKQSHIQLSSHTLTHTHITKTIQQLYHNLPHSDETQIKRSCYFTRNFTRHPSTDTHTHTTPTNQQANKHSPAPIKTHSHIEWKHKPNAILYYKNCILLMIYIIYYVPLFEFEMR